jgi:hypothetical protein
VSPFVVAGLLAGIVSIVDPIPYIRDVRRGLTRPHRGTWLIWSVLGVTAFWANLADGGTWSLAMIGVQALTMSVVFLLSLRYGVGGVSRAELALIALAGAGVLGWALSSHPVVATAFVVAADLIGVALMLPKTWRDPHSETLSTFALASLAGVLSAIAVGALDPGLLLYPAYFACANGGVAALIVLRRAERRRPAGWRAVGLADERER